MQFAQMKKTYISILFLIILFSAIYGFSTMPKNINKTYTGIAYKENDNSFQQKVIVKLQGVYNKKSKVFQGKLFINDLEYTNCTLSSLTTWICYIDGNRYLMGQFYSDEDLQQISFLVQNEELYKNFSNENIGSDRLIISAPAAYRAEAIELNNKLKQYGAIDQP